MKIVYKTPNEIDPYQGEETCVGKSMTVPGLAMTIPELMARNASGIQPAVIGFEEGEDENFDDVVPELDIIDLHDMAERLEVLKAKQVEEAKKLKQKEGQKADNEAPAEAKAEPSEVVAK